LKGLFISETDFMLFSFALDFMRSFFKASVFALRWFSSIACPGDDVDRVDFTASIRSLYGVEEKEPPSSAAADAPSSSKGNMESPSRVPGDL
jgi:hypothetical protein